MIAGVALVVFALGLCAEPFVDEYAYITQSFYTDLFSSAHRDDVAWLDWFAYDLPPLPKYLIGLSLRAAHLPMPTPEDAWRWYFNYGTVGDEWTLLASRLPIVLLGAMGCVAIFACGALVRDARCGAIAAALLILNPLYRLHAHRAMSDVPCEALVLVALALALWAWKRTWSGRNGGAVFVLSLGAGIASGLSILCKFSGFLGPMVIAAWALIALVARRLTHTRKLVITTAAATSLAVAPCVFVALNPFMTARPRRFLPPVSSRLAKLGLWKRFEFLVDHRVSVSKVQQQRFPLDALYTPSDKANVLAVQGFGRFGPFGPSRSDSTKRFDLRQDLGMALWGPWVLVGLLVSIYLARRQFLAGEAPTALALVVWAVLAWSVVTLYLPMAWDRYLLPIQSPNVLLAAMAATSFWDLLSGRIPALGTRT